MLFCVFFFQAEDGIRDDLVTGVQTCALPISAASSPGSAASPKTCVVTRAPSWCARSTASARTSSGQHGPRSEERRVGKECRSRGAPEHSKKKVHRVDRA